MNFKVLKCTVGYARRTAAEQGKLVDFSLTTNATLLQPDVIDFLADERIGVTISIDGPQEIQDKFRVFSNGKGSYDIAAPKIKALLARHTTRPIGARVTLTKQTLDVQRIYRHLFDEMGFWEVGFAPVTTAPQRDHAISDSGYDDLLEQFRALAHEFLQASLQGRHHGFSNVRETLQEIHHGHAKAYPCGAGIGLLGVATDGQVSLCHRFAGSDAHRFGSVTEGIDRGQAGVVPRRAPHRAQDRLQPVLGPADLRRRLLPRGPHPLRRHHAAQPALLRVDPRLDPHLSRDLRRARREEPAFLKRIRRSRR